PVAPNVRALPLGFGPSAASATEDGSVDLAFVEDGSGAVFYGRVAPPVAVPSPVRVLGSLASIPFARVSDGAVDVPLVTSLSWEGVHLIVPRASGVFASRTYRPPIVSRGRGRGTVSAAANGVRINLGLAWEPFRQIAPGGLLLGSLVPLGDGEIALAAADRTGRIWAGRFADGRWGMFLPLQGQTSLTVTAPPVRPALAVK